MAGSKCSRLGTWVVFLHEPGDDPPDAIMLQ